MIPLPFFRSLYIAFGIGAVLAVSGNDFQSSKSSIKHLPLEELEQRRADIENELSDLAHYSLRSGVGAIGYRSKDHDHSHSLEWIRIDLGQQATIDEIILVPTIWRDTELGFISDGFPVEFKILAGRNDDQAGHIIATFTKDDQVLPRIAPLVIPFDQVEASWIRIEASLLSPRAYDGRFSLQFAEVMVFNETENLALGAKVETSSEYRVGAGAWNPEHLVSGFLPYLMDSAEGEQSLPFVSATFEGSRPFILIDLGKPYTLTQLNFHTVDQSDTVPQAFQGDYGIPKSLTIEGANSRDFSDSKLLLEYKQSGILEIAPIIMKRLKPVECRFVRLSPHELYHFEGTDADGSPLVGPRIGFAEIELFEGDQNVAQGKRVESNFVPGSSVRLLSALTDGQNLYGKILPLQQWMHELARRHELEFERPLIESELEQRYEIQKARLRILSWIVAALLVVAVFVYLINRFLRQRAIFDIRNRIAADLHDELGANLHAVTLLGELASKAKDDPEKVQGLIERIRSLTQRTSKAVKYCTNILETPGLYEDFEDAMVRNADRLLADLDHKLIFEAKDTISRLKASKRIDLFLFYKECLINIIRHSGATKAETRLKTEGKDLHLQVSDNGCGFPDSAKANVPAALKRRAKMLGGKVMINSPQNGGAQIHLFMHI